jgi:uncharacterized integral membrane protein
MQIYWILALIFGIIIALFAVQNSEPITVQFLWFTADAMPVSVLILISACLGALVTLMFGLAREVRFRWRGFSARRTISSQEKHVADLEASVEQLTREKAELQARLDTLTGSPSEAPRFEAVPVDPTKLAEQSEPPSLPEGRSR